MVYQLELGILYNFTKSIISSIFPSKLNHIFLDNMHSDYLCYLGLDSCSFKNL